VTAEPSHATVQYPGGIRAAMSWVGSGGGRALHALTEAGIEPVDHGPLVGADAADLCRAELRVETPSGNWAIRLASAIFDAPRGLFWDDTGLLVIGYGFHVYGLAARSGRLAWTHRSATPVIELLGSTRLEHVIAQAELETFAIERDGKVGWRLAHSDVVVAAELVGGRLVVTSFDGQLAAFDAGTGRPAG
jgi:outer membrane protein assembly factor BamB